MAEWTGIVAFLDQRTEDGRTLATPRELDTGSLPLPFVVTSSRIESVGTVEQVFIDGPALRATGTVRDGILTPGQDAPVGVDVDQITWDAVRDGVAVDWRLRAVHLYLGDGADLRPAWPEARVRLND